jgi:hypothetical protein
MLGRVRLRLSGNLMLRKSPLERSKLSAIPRHSQEDFARGILAIAYTENMYRLEYVPVTGTWYEDPDRFDHWESLEQNKLRANRHMEHVRNPKTGRAENKNYGVFKTKTLGQVRDERLALYRAQGMNDDEIYAHIAAYRMSHGHCVKSAY